MAEEAAEEAAPASEEATAAEEAAPAAEYCRGERVKLYAVGRGYVTVM